MHRNVRPSSFVLLPFGAAIGCALVAAAVLADGARLAAAESSTSRRREFTQVHMGTEWRIVLYSADESIANRAAGAAFDRVAELDRILSDYDPASELSRLSATAGSGRAVKIGDDLWHVLRRSQELAAATDGAFDVTVGPLTKMWRSARRSKRFPPDERMAEARAAVGFEKLELDAAARTAKLAAPNMRLDLGGIAMGYAADEALEVVTRHGIVSAMIDASGDIVCSAPPPGETGWKIGIAPLTESKGPPSRYVRLAHSALTTSGDAFQYVEIDGVRYSHIVDPETGRGLTTRSSVTVTARDCLSADSLATAVSVLGPERGRKLIATVDGAAALVVVREGEAMRTIETPGFTSEPAP